MRIRNYYNADYGKRIFGFEETAMDELKKYPWPGNITQLSQIISLLVMQTKDLYISESIVRYQLGEEKTVEDAAGELIRHNVSYFHPRLRKYTASYIECNRFICYDDDIN